MGIVRVDDSGIMFVDYDPGTPLPNETHILNAPAGGLWTFLANGATGMVTVTDGAAPPAEVVFYQSPNGTAWRLRVMDNGVLLLDDSAQKRVLSPIGNDQVKKPDGSLAVGWRLRAFVPGTIVPAPLWGAREGFVLQPDPIVLNALALPDLPIFIEIGVGYDFVLYDDLGVEIYRWPSVSVGELVNPALLNEWIPGTFPTFVSATSFSVSTDQRSTYQVGRRVRLGTGTGPITATVTQARFANGLTNITVVVDRGAALVAPLTSVDYGLLTATQSSIPDRIIKGLTTQFVGPVNIPGLQLSLFPAGIVAKFGPTVPAPWIVCDGGSKAVASFPELFKAIGYTFGGAGPNFNVPDERGDLVLGKDNMGGTPAGRVTAASVGGANALVLGGRGGEEVHLLTVPELPVHSHQRSYVASLNSDQAGATNQTATSRGDYAVRPTGGGGAHSTTPPWFAMNKGIWPGGSAVLSTTAFSNGFSLGFY